MERSHKVMLALALLLASASCFLSAVLFSRTSDQQDRLDAQQADISAQQGRLVSQQAKICVVQGVGFAGVLANLGLALQEAVFLKSHANDPQIRAYYRAVAPALRTTLDATFSKPPKCGQKFEFTIQIEGEKKRHVVTPGK